MLVVVCAGHASGDPTSDPAEAKRRLDAARALVEKLEALAFAQRPDLKEAIAERAQAEAAYAADDRGLRTRTLEYLQAQRTAGNHAAQESYERLRGDATQLRVVELAEELDTASRLKLLLPTPEVVGELMERVKLYGLSLPEGAERDPRKTWDALREQLVALKPELARHAGRAARDAGLPDHAVEQARREGRWRADAGYFDAYIALRTPPALRAARDAAHEAALRLPPDPAPAAAAAAGAARPSRETP